MADIGFVAFWVHIVFGGLVAASYVGTKLALRSYFGGEALDPSDVVSVGNGAESGR